MGAATLRETSKDQLDTLMTTRDLPTAFLPVAGPPLLKESLPLASGALYLSPSTHLKCQCIPGLWAG